MSVPLRRGGPPFDGVHRALVGAAVDLADLDVGAFPPALVDEARRVWLDRLRTEHRSIQVMARFLAEVSGAGDPLEVVSCAVELVRDEVRHAELCADVCRALGVAPALPERMDLRDPEAFLRAPMAERALHTAIAMLLVNESISVAFIADLRVRCDHAPMRRVLDLTLADEDEHAGFGEAYVRKSLARFPASAPGRFQELVRRTLAPFYAGIRPILAAIPPEKRALEAWPDAERVRIGLFSKERQALVCDRAIRELAPRLERIGLWPADLGAES